MKNEIKNPKMMITGNWQKAILPTKSTIQDAIINLDQVAIKIVLVVNELGEFVGTISDGDIRRGLLNGLQFQSPIDGVINRNALVVPPSVGGDLVTQLMVANKIQQIPILDERRKIVGLHLWDEVVSKPARSNPMVIMAGGEGVRLRPHTENCPKPLLPIAGKPILEHIIENAKREGFSKFIVSVNYLAKMIIEYFGSGERWGVSIDFVHEDYPLGTAGSLSLISPKPTEPIVITNGDVVTDIRYGELLDFHKRCGACATMAVRVHEWQNPFGVVLTEGIKIIGFEEKPKLRSHINAGVYVLNPEVLELLSMNEHCDMPALFQRAKAREKNVVAYPMHEPWLDIGRPTDLVKADEKMRKEIEIKSEK